MNPIDKIALIFRSPLAFYKKVTKEGLMEPFVFFVVLFAVYQFVFSILEVLFSINTTTDGIVVVAIGAVIGYVLALIIAGVGPWFSAGITHLGVLLFKGKGDYTDTFKITTYSSIINFAYLIPVQLANLFLLRDPTNIPYIITGAVISVPIAIAGIVHVVYAQIQGFKLYHNMSTGKALVSILVIPIGIGLIIFAGFMLLFAAMMIPMMAVMR